MRKIDKNIESDDFKQESKESHDRRHFLKKAAYSAPVLLVLGQLAQPTKAEADSGPPTGPPTWGGF